LSRVGVRWLPEHAVGYRKTHLGLIHTRVLQQIHSKSGRVRALAHVCFGPGDMRKIIR